MPTCLLHTMSDEEIFRHIAMTYASPSQYEPFEKDVGDGQYAQIKPWIERDQGEYARRGLKIIVERLRVPE